MQHRASMVPDSYKNQASTMFFPSVPLPSTGLCFQELLRPCTEEQALTLQVTLYVIRLYSSLASCILIFSKRATSSGFWGRKIKWEGYSRLARKPCHNHWFIGFRGQSTAKGCQETHAFISSASTALETFLEGSVFQAVKQGGQYLAPPLQLSRI